MIAEQRMLHALLDRCVSPSTGELATTLPLHSSELSDASAREAEADLRRALAGHARGSTQLSDARVRGTPSYAPIAGQRVDDEDDGDDEEDTLDTVDRSADPWASTSDSEHAGASWELTLVGFNASETVVRARNA